MTLWIYLEAGLVCYATVARQIIDKWTNLHELFLFSSVFFFSNLKTGSKEYSSIILPIKYSSSL